MLDGFDDELVIAGQVEERAAGPRVGQLDQGLVHQRVLRNEKQETDLYTNGKIKTPHRTDVFQSRTGFMGLPLNFYML